VLAEIVKLPLNAMTLALAALYFVFLVLALWRARTVGVDNIQGGYRLDPKASTRVVGWGHIKMVLFGRTQDRPLRALFWLTRLAAALYVLLMLVTFVIVQSPYRMSLAWG
jgi:hypothetical protein